MSWSVDVEIKNAGLLLEGPHWEPESKNLLFVDIKGHSIFRYNVLTKEIQKHVLESTPGFIIPSSIGGYVIGMTHKILHLDLQTQAIRTIGRVDEKYPENRLNDGKCDEAGRLWAGTMHCTNAMNRKDGSLYSLNENLIIRQHLENIGISNGLAWNSDSSVFYYIDSITETIDAFDYDLPNGEISNRRKAVDFYNKDRDIFNVPDGMCIDQNGKLWVATFGGGQIIQVDPSTGQKLQIIDMPAKHVTSCCFGGTDYSDLYVTTCKKDDHDGKIYPLAGSIFKVTGLGTKGLPPYIFEGPSLVTDHIQPNAT